MVDLPVDVLWISRYDYRRGWRLRPHEHDFLQMILFLDGKGVFTIGGQEYPIHGGEAILIREGETHGLRAEAAVRTLDVKFRVSPGPLARSLAAAAHVLETKGDMLATRFERIRAEGERKAPLYRELCSVLMTEILYLYLREGAQPAAANEAAGALETAAHDQVTQRALACIRANYRRPLTIREIARAAGCTDRTLRLHFHDALQMRPLGFLQRYRVEQAKVLIRHSVHTLKEIAELVGFQTVHHFTRLFTAEEGIGPAAWRRKYLEGIRKDVYINPEFENRIFTIGDGEG